MRLSVKNRPLKITHSYEYTFDNNIVKISLSKKSLLFPVFNERENRQIGFLLEGPLGIVADLIVHSDKGAVGELFEETFNTVIFLPADLPFLSLDHVKEANPVENFEPYEDIIRKYNRMFSLNTIGITDISKHKIIVTQKPQLFWVISPDGTFVLSKKEILGRRGQKRLIWISKKGLVSVNKEGRYRSISEMLQVKDIKQSFNKIFGKPLTELFSSIQNEFSKFT
jgi:hypothetical protein